MIYSPSFEAWQVELSEERKDVANYKKGTYAGEKTAGPIEQKCLSR